MATACSFLIWLMRRARREIAFRPVVGGYACNACASERQAAWWVDGIDPARRQRRKGGFNAVVSEARTVRSAGADRRDRGRGVLAHELRRPHRRPVLSV